MLLQGNIYGVVWLFGCLVGSLCIQLNRQPITNDLQPITNDLQPNTNNLSLFIDILFLNNPSQIFYSLQYFREPISYR